ncbi:hypothetical protein, partial [Duodenibacillus massiliensis]|uniref:hypothetical protein n=1 Tax=Duodenibacillus massiliensis TaxID=1852381 RepID=UPI00307A5668
MQSIRLLPRRFSHFQTQSDRSHKYHKRGIMSDQYRSLPGPGPGKDAMLSVGPKQCVQKTAV